MYLIKLQILNCDIIQKKKERQFFRKNQSFYALQDEICLFNTQEIMNQYMHYFDIEHRQGEFKFTFGTMLNQFLCQATSQKDKKHYIGKTQNIQAMNQIMRVMYSKKEIKIISKTEDLLFISIGKIPMLLPLSKIPRVDEIKQQLSKTQEQREKQFSQMVQQNIKIANQYNQFVKEDEKHQLQLKSKKKPYKIAQLQSQSKKLNQQLIKCYRWSEKLKHKNIMIKNNKVKVKNLNSKDEFCLVQAGLTHELKQKQCWAIKVKQITPGPYQIKLGICLQSILEAKKFQVESEDWQKTEHGCYMIVNCAVCFSHSEKKFNNINHISFMIENNDTIYMEYDPIRWRLRFQKKKQDEKFVMPIGELKQGEVYHPCVSLHNRFNEVQLELIYPGIPLS